MYGRGKILLWPLTTSYLVWFYALNVLGNFTRDSLLPNNDVDSFAQKYLRWDSQKCNKRLLTNILCWYHLILTRLWCIAIKQGTIRIEILWFFSSPFKVWGIEKRWLSVSDWSHFLLVRSSSRNECYVLLRVLPPLCCSELPYYHFVHLQGQALPVWRLTMAVTG